MGPREAHIRELSNELSVMTNLYERETFLAPGRVHGIFYGSTSINFVPKIEVYKWSEYDQRAYIAGIHELGHIALNHHIDQAMYWNNAFEEEIKVWLWTFEKTREVLEDTTKDFVNWCLGTYYTAAMPYQRKNLLIPEYEMKIGRHLTFSY